MAETNKGIYYPTFAEVGEETYDGPVKMKMMAESIDPLLLSDEDKTKLDNIEAGAEVNVIESVKVNGTALTITDKAVDVPVPTKTSDLTNDSGFGTYSKPNGGIPSTDLSSAVQTSLGKADTAVQDVSGKEDKSNKVTSISSSSTNTQYPSAKLLYDQLAEKQEQIDALVEENSTLKKQQLKGQASGSSIQLTDSAEGLPIENVKLKGAMSQNTYNGYNLLNPYLINQTVNGVTINYDSETQEITLNGTCTTDNTHFDFNSNIDGITVQSNGKLYGKIVYVSGSSEGYLALRAFKEDYTGTNLIVYADNGVTQNISGSVTCTANTTFTHLSIRANSNSIFNNLKIKLMFSTENVNYEPYCGAQVSPNKDYPQEVHCVTGDCNVRVTNKNLFNKNNANVVNGLLADSGKFQSSSYEKAIIFNTNPNVTYTISRNANNRSFFRVAETSQYPNFEIDYKNRIKQDYASKITYTTSDSAKYLIINFYSNNDVNLTLIEMLDSIQIEKNTTNTEYVTNQEQNAPLSLGTIGLYDGDKIQISFIDKAGYKKVTGGSIIRKWKKYTFTGNETIDTMDNNTLYSLILSNYSNRAKIENPRNSRNLANIYSNKFTAGTQESTKNNINQIALSEWGVQTPRQFIYFNINIASSVAECQQVLASNYIVYELETPETTAITDPTLLSQLETLINMKTYKQITNIEATGSDLSPVLEFQYSKDLQTVIDNMQAQILS